MIAETFADIRGGLRTGGSRRTDDGKPTGRKDQDNMQKAIDKRKRTGFRERRG